MADDPWKEVVDSAISNGDGVKGLSEMRLAALPNAFIQPPEARIVSAAMIGASSSSATLLPAIIDMSKAEAAESICNAARKWGFFQVVNHGVPAAADGVMAAAQRFFDQSAEQKRRLIKENSKVRYGSSFLAKAEKVLEWKDYLSLPFISEDSASSLWPPICKDETLEYLKSSEGLIKRVLQILMNNLNVEKIEETIDQSPLMGSKTINFNYYPICPNPDLAVGVGRHSDISVLTVLLQDEVGGLHVRRRIEDGGGEDYWVHVRPVAGSLVINIGDSLEIMSNGLYHSVEHCVVANGSRNRISIPIFVTPEHSTIVGPLPEVLATGQKAKYKQILYSDYARHFFTKPHDGKDTLEFAKIII